MTGVDVIAGKLEQLNRTERSCGLPELHAQDRSFRDRKLELISRCLALPEGERPSVELLASIGALCAAFIDAVDASEIVDVSSGEEAA